MIVPTLGYVEAKVAGVNRLQRMTHEPQQKINELFTPYVGKKVLNADGRLIKALRDGIEAVRVGLIRDNNDSRMIGLNLWVEVSSYSVFLYVRMDLHDAKYPGSVETMRAERYLARINNAILTDVEPVRMWAEVEAAKVHQSIVEIDELEQRVRSIQDSISLYFRP